MDYSGFKHKKTEISHQNGDEVVLQEEQTKIDPQTP